MAEMLSWHRAGQQVALVDDAHFIPIGYVPEDQPPTLQQDVVYTIWDVVVLTGKVVFILCEIGRYATFEAAAFRPVFPNVVDRLRRLEMPAGSPEPVLE